MTYPPPPNDPYGNQPPPPPYGAPGGYGAPAVAYASWLQRVGAFLIDWAIGLPLGIIGGVVGMRTDSAGNVSYNSLYFVFALLNLVLWGYNRWYLAGKTGQSWGKKALSIRLVTEQTGQPVGALLAFGRDILHIIDSICLIGYLFPLWDAKKQTLSDKMVKTIVVTG